MFRYEIYHNSDRPMETVTLLVPLQKGDTIVLNYSNFEVAGIKHCIKVIGGEGNQSDETVSTTKVYVNKL